MVHFRKVAVSWTTLFLVNLCFVALTLYSSALEPPGIFPESGELVAPARVKLRNPNPSGAIFYTADGTDPRGEDGTVRSGAQVYSDSVESHDFVGPFSANRSMVVRCRVKSGEDWSEMKTATFIADQDFSKLLVTEIMFHPTNGPPESEYEEFIEFKLSLIHI